MNSSKMIKCRPRKFLAKHSDSRLFTPFVLLLSSFLFAQNPANQPAEIKIKTVQMIESAEGSLTIEGKVDQAIYEAFIKKYPYIKIQGGSLPLLIEGLGAESHLLLSIAGGTAPDILELLLRQSGTYIEEGFLYPLDEWIREDLTAAEAREKGIYDDNIMYKEELEQRFPPQLMNALFPGGRDVKKHFYFLPRLYETRILAINKTLFRKAGLDPVKDVPQTWDELWEVSKKLTNPQDNEYGFFGTSAYDLYLSWVTYPFMLSMDSRAVKRDPVTGEWRASFNDEGAIRAADFWIKMVSAPWVHPRTGQHIRGVGENNADIWIQWYRGKVGMILLTSNDILMNYNLWLNTMNYDELGIAKIPASPIGKRTTELYLRIMGIIANTRDPRVRDAAWKYIRFIGSSEGRRVSVDTYVQNNFGRYVMPELLQEYGYDEYVDEVPKEWAEAVRYSFAHSVPDPFGRNTQHIYPMMSSPVLKALNEDLGANPDSTYRLARLRQLFDEAVVVANERMMGIIPPDQVFTRKLVAFIIASLIFIMFIILFVYIWRVFTPQQVQSATAQSHFRKYRFAYLLLTPAILGVLVFNYYPLLRGALMAFQDYKVMGGTKFIGLTNFALVFYDNAFWMSIVIAGYYTLLFIIMVFIPPIFLAVLLTEIPAGKIAFRVVYYLPAVISGIVMMIMWRNFFDPSADGLLNQVLVFFGFEPLQWLGSKSTAMVSVMIPQGWAGIGPGCLIYLAALKTVPDELYEAVAIDGGGFFNRLRFVTIPSIKSLIFIQLIFAVIGAFQASDAVLVMTAGGPDNATMTVGLEIFFNAYMFQRFGVATSMAWILGFLLMGLTMFQMRRLSRMTFKTAKA